VRWSNELSAWPFACPAPFVRYPPCRDAQTSQFPRKALSQCPHGQTLGVLSVLASFRSLPLRSLTFGQPIIDTHCHLLPTFTSYRLAYPDGAYTTLPEFVSGLYKGVETVIDVWCDVTQGRIGNQWREVADSAADWTSLDYRFVIGPFDKIH
jgi:hypothetical protein